MAEVEPIGARSKKEGENGTNVSKIARNVTKKDFCITRCYCVFILFLSPISLSVGMLIGKSDYMAVT